MTAAARTAFSLRHFGASDVRVMNGGMLKWLKEGRSSYSGPYTPGKGLSDEGCYDFDPVDKEAIITEVEKMHHIAYYLANKATDYQVVDTRLPEIFFSEGYSESFRNGHINESINLPFNELTDPSTFCLLPNKELAAMILRKQIDTTQPIVVTCNTGVTACIAELALRILGAERIFLYDGSWQQYGATGEPDFYHGSKHGWGETGK